MAQTEKRDFLFDRSRLETYQRCPRRYWWNYAYKGLGVTPLRRPLPLAFGGAVHLGLQRLLEGASIEAAVGAASQEFEDVARTRGFELAASDDQRATYLEHNALLEALLRAWALVRLPSFLEEYEVVEVEREEEYEVVSGITLMARADGILRQRATGDLYILSFKTARQYSGRDREARTDVQGISEVVAAESRLGERVQGIQMEYLVKGPRIEWPKGSGIYQVSNPLIRPWVHSQDDTRYAHSWDWSDPDGGHTLGTKYRKVPIWERMPISTWIDMLHAGQVQPEAGNPLERFIVSPLPYLRNRDEINSWKRQAAQQATELAVKGQSTEVARQDTTTFVTTLDALFPQYRHSCNYPTRCPYQDICFGPAGPEPETSGYTWREPHHEREARELAEREAQ